MYRVGKKQPKENIIKSMRNLFNLKKENKEIKYGIKTDITTLFEQEEKDYYKPIRVSNFWNNYSVEYESIKLNHT